MKRFKNILVGVDLSSGDRLVTDTLLENALAVRQATWLAKLSHARIKFVYALDITERAQQMILQSEGEHTVREEARKILQMLAEHAKADGVSATFDVVFGSSYVELIRQVLTFEHDLVVIGTSSRSTTSRIIFGSTGMHLLRKCPCPVWITKPSEREQIATVLVAHDLTPVGSLSLELGASLSELHNSALHVIHVLEPDDEIVTYTASPADPKSKRSKNARLQIESELRSYKLATPPRIAVVDGEPPAAILSYINQQQIELIVMGTIARSGVRGVIAGNTAESLFPQLPCSILAVKPADFVSPVTR